MLAGCEETDDADRAHDDPDARCVFVDMRPGAFDALIREAAAELAALREQLAETQANAERYMWLRDEAVHYRNENGKATPWVVYGTHAGDAVPKWEHNLDADIDKARAVSA